MFIGFILPSSVYKIHPRYRTFHSQTAIRWLWNENQTIMSGMPHNKHYLLILIEGMLCVRRKYNAPILSWNAAFHLVAHHVRIFTTIDIRNACYWVTRPKKFNLDHQSLWTLIPYDSNQRKYKSHSSLYVIGVLLFVSLGNAPTVLMHYHMSVAVRIHVPFAPIYIFVRVNKTTRMDAPTSVIAAQSFELSPSPYITRSCVIILGRKEENDYFALTSVRILFL